ncbi:DUF2294 domain-containing protein [Oceanispirochaeta sp.]|jgi:uncharacterized protein YbcI|uniref:DUF2294 domain-containing protein n=1 Tax=Oceanispirochaeta sp. TaxID=2035350 RepID=UPI0026057126|nr:DUF2294 domain-containing protein [Oceanispirochaeta sp.]MDA3957207.1 DUF2294 domain-containing protein [Oceanispirochaeta sp.]
MTKGQMEEQICKALIHFEKEYMGRGPLEAKSYIIDDMVVLRMKGVLTPAENKLASSQEIDNGRAQIKQMRRTLIENGRTLLESVLQDILKVGIISMHSDLSTKTGERIIIFTLESAPDLT